MKPATTSQYRSQFMLVGAVILLFTLYMYLPASGGPGIRGGGVEKPFKIAIPARMDFLIVSDLDKRSAIEGLKKPRWKAVLKRVSWGLGNRFLLAFAPPLLLGPKPPGGAVWLSRIHLLHGSVWADLLFYAAGHSRCCG